MPMPSFDPAAIQAIVDRALEVMGLYSDLLLILGGIILAGLVLDYLIRQIQKPPM